MNAALNSLRVYLSSTHPCPYLEQEQAASLIIDPEVEIDTGCLTELTRSGFRRSGDLVYRPHCPKCRECLSIRVPSTGFQPNRSQRRVVRRNQDLAVQAVPAEFRQEHLELYRSYQLARHPDSEMCDPDPQKYFEFVVGTAVQTSFFEFRSDGALVAVAVSDELDDAVSAVYTFFDPTLEHRSLGTYAILWQIDYCRRTHRDWLYLGYWIEESRKMRYKSAFRPAQVYEQGRWRTLGHR